MKKKVGKFKLLASRRCGEAIVRECGFTCFPIDPFQIAEKNDIMIQPKPPDLAGVSGGIIFREENVLIFYSTHIKSTGFQRFTIAHELGHYFLDGHPDEICGSGGAHISRAGFSEGDSSIELEADHFASGLLLPTHLVIKQLRKEVVGLTAIEALANLSECSLTASAIRAAECSEYPMAIVVSADSEIKYGFLSDSFKKLGRLQFPRKGMPLPESATLEFNKDTENVRLNKRFCAETSLSHWFDGDKEISLDEEVVGLGSYGLTLSIFSSDKLTDDPELDDDDETELLDSWTPKFARRR